MGVAYAMSCVPVLIHFGHLYMKSHIILCNILVNLVQYPSIARIVAVLVISTNLQSQMCDMYTCLPGIHAVATLLRECLVSLSRHCFQVSENIF